MMENKGPTQVQNQTNLAATSEIVPAKIQAPRL